MNVCTVCFTLITANGECMCDALGVSTKPEPPAPARTFRVVHVDDTLIPDPIAVPAPRSLPLGADAWTRRYAWHLESIPELLSRCRSRVIPLQASRYAERVDSSGDPHRLPLRVEPVDDADLLWSLLVLYATEVAYHLGGSSPSILREGHWSTNEVQGVRAGTAPERAAQGAALIAGWLVDRAEQIGPFAAFQESEDQLFALVRSLRLRYGVEERPRPGRARKCAVCGFASVVAMYATVAGREASLVTCSTCGASGKEAVYGKESDLLAGSETGSPQHQHNPSVATIGDADGA